MLRISRARARAQNHFQVYSIHTRINRAFHRLVNALISDLRLQHLPGASLTTTDYRIGSLSGEIDKLIARTPDLEKDEIKVWLLKPR
jgi:hypothetical protein